MSGTAHAAAGRRPLAQGRYDAVPVDGEVVVWREHGIHRLNATAALVWSRCDGATDLDTIVRSLAGEFRVAEDTVRRDVVTALDELAARGLVLDGTPGDALPMIEPPIQCTGCGDGPTFAARILLVVDEGLLAVGVDAELAPELAAAFGELALGVVEPGRTSYGLVVPEKVDGPRQEVARLYRGPDLLSRARHPELVVDALVAQVGAHVVPRGCVLLEAVAVGRPGRVALVAPPANRVAFERSVAALDLATAPGTVVVVGPDRRAVLTGAPWLRVDRERVARAVRDRAHSGGALPTLTPGEHEVVALAASTPSVATIFGELAPSRSFDVGDGPLRALHAMGAALPLLPSDDLEALSRTIGGRPAP